MILRSGRQAFNRLRSQQFPTEADDHIPASAADLDADRLIAEVDLKPAERLSDLTAGRSRPAGVWLIAAAVAVILLVVGTSPLPAVGPAGTVRRPHSRTAA